MLANQIKDDHFRPMKKQSDPENSSSENAEKES